MTERVMDEALYLARAACALKAGHREAALSLCTEILAANPFSVNALRIVKTCWDGRQLSRLRLVRVRLWFALMDQIHRGMPQKRMRLAQRFLITGFSDVHVYQSLAISSCALEAWPVAQFAYETLLEKVPDSLDFCLELAQVCLFLGNLDSTLSWTKRILTQAPAHLEAQALAREAAVRQAMAHTA